MLYAFGFERVGATRRLLDQVRAGQLGTAPPDPAIIRAGWL